MNMVSNAADEKQVKDAERKGKLAKDNELSDVKFILSTEAGRRFIWKTLERCKVYELSFNHSGAITSFNEGMRNIGLIILSDVMGASPEAYLQMMKENKKENL